MQLITYTTFADVHVKEPVMRNAPFGPVIEVSVLMRGHAGQFLSWQGLLPADGWPVQELDLPIEALTRWSLRLVSLL